MSKLSWFKHYNDASNGDTIQQFISNHDYESVTLFWFLLEYLSRNDTPDRTGETSIQLKFLSRGINMKPTKVLKLLSRFTQIAHKWNLSVIGEEIKFRVPNWLEMQENRGLKKVKKIDENTLEERREKKEVRSKNKESAKSEILTVPLEPSKQENLNSWTPKVGHRFKELWKKKYGRDYLPWAAKENTQIKNWAISVGAQNWYELLEAYFNWNTPFVARSGHPVNLLVTKTPELISDLTRAKEKINAANEYSKAAKEIETGNNLEDLKKHEQELFEKLKRRNNGTKRELQNSNERCLP